jgi:tetratricopeptide (TPR) repeat protein
MPSWQVLSVKLGLCGAALWLSAGCRTTAENGVAESTPRSLFRPKFLSASDSQVIPEEEVEVLPPLKDTTELTLAYARWMEDVGNLVEARRHYTEVTESKPKNIEAILGLARIDQLSGRPHEAEQGFLRALKLDENSPVALHALGQFYASQERWQEAATQLNRAMLSAPTEKKYRYDLAVVLVHTGDVNAALPHFVRTVGDAEAHYNVGLILREEGKLDEAADQMLQAVTKKPDLHEAQYWLDEIHRERETVLASHSSMDAAAGPVVAPSNISPTGGSHSLQSGPVRSSAALSTQQQDQRRNQRPLP